MDFRIEPDASIKLEHLNVRSERHGDKDVTAVDLKLEWTTGNVVLDQLHGALKECLYMHEVVPSKLPGIETVLSVRIFPQLEPLHWSGEVASRKLVIRHGIRGDADLILPACLVDRFVIQPLDGGTVCLTFRVRAICEDERILGRLPLLLNRQLPMGLLPDVSVAAEQQEEAEAIVWPFPKKPGREPKEYVTGEERRP